jgi:ssDNA-binding Zn-finger/Zn-ribbon topoisomerase 1
MEDFDDDWDFKRPEINIPCSKCKTNLEQIEYIDNFHSCLCAGVPEEKVNTWLGKHDEGYLMKCPQCGEWHYFSDSEFDAIVDPEGYEEFTKEMEAHIPTMIKEIDNFFKKF